MDTAKKGSDAVTEVRARLPARQPRGWLALWPQVERHRVPYVGSAVGSTMAVEGMVSAYFRFDFPGHGSSPVNSSKPSSALTRTPNRVTSTSGRSSRENHSRATVVSVRG